MKRYVPADSDTAFERYVREAYRHPLLTAEEEDRLARSYRDTGDASSAHRLIASNLRFVLKIAHDYRGYGAPLADLVQEGNVGLTVAVGRFDPDRGCRLISYAIWWIRACMGAYVMRSWSLVKVGTTQTQRKLFFKLRSEHALASRKAAQHEAPSTGELAVRLGVPEADVSDMAMRLAGRDLSLNATRCDESRETRLETLPDAHESLESAVQREQIRRLVRTLTEHIMNELDERQRYIVSNRLLTLEPQSLRRVGAHLNISGERARQIEIDVLHKLRERLRSKGIGAAA